MKTWGEEVKFEAASHQEKKVAVVSCFTNLKKIIDLHSSKTPE